MIIDYSLGIWWLFTFAIFFFAAFCWFPPWFDGNVIRLLKFKEFYFDKWKTTTLHYKEFSRLRSPVKTKIHVGYHSYQASVEHNILTDPHSFWQYITAKYVVSRIPRFVFFNHVKLDNPADVIQAFAELFSITFQFHHTVTPVYTPINKHSVPLDVGLFTVILYSWLCSRVVPTSYSNF